MEEVAMTQVAWVLLYIQGGVAEAWKDNLLDKLAKGELEVETAEQLFSKIRNDWNIGGGEKDWAAKDNRAGSKDMQQVRPRIQEDY